MNSREIILKAIYNIEEKGEYFNASLSGAISLASPVDRAFVTEVIYGIVKNKLSLDHIIGQFSSVKIKKMSPWVKNLLRLGVYQMYYMDKIPHSAACNESVKLASKYANKSRGFINAVLRNVSRNIDSISFPEKENGAEYLSLKYSFPLWLTKKLLKQYSFEKCESFMAESNRSHRVNIRVNPLLITPEKLIEVLKDEGVTAEVSPLFDGCLSVLGQINIDALPSYKKGYFSLQNISSYKAIKVLSPEKGERIMDICAAPGGKSCAIAEMMENEGEVLSFDVYKHKTELIKKSADRLNIHIIKAEVHDGREEIPSLIGQADKVLLDAPCSGIGVIHKKPDIKWSREENDIAELAKIQSELLEVSSRYVKDGGVLLYSTCTVLKEENNDITSSFLKKHPEFIKTYEEQILTGENGESGFYICKMEKKG